MTCNSHLHTNTPSIPQNNSPKNPLRLEGAGLIMIVKLKHTQPVSSDFNESKEKIAVVSGSPSQNGTWILASCAHARVKWC